MAAIEVEHLRRVFRTTIGLLRRRTGKDLAVDDLSFQVSDGELFGLQGPNGAGRTTTVKILTTLLILTVGTARVAGKSVGQEAV